MNYAGIYLIRCKENGRIYIGSSKNVYYRLTDHKRFLRNGLHHCRKMQDDYNLYGADTFEYQIIEFCSEQERLKREKYYMEDVYCSLNTPNGYNQAEINLNKDYIRHYSKIVTHDDVYAIKMLSIVGLSKNLIAKMLHKSWRLVSDIVDLKSYIGIYSELNDFISTPQSFELASNSGVRFDDFFKRSEHYGFSLDCILHNFYCFISELPDICIYQSDIDYMLSLNSYVGRIYFCFLVIWRKLNKVFPGIKYIPLHPEKIIPLTTLNMQNNDFYEAVTILSANKAITLNNSEYFINDSFTGDSVQIVGNSVVGLYYDLLFYPEYKVCCVCNNLFPCVSNGKYCSDCKHIISDMKKNHDLSFYKYEKQKPKYDSMLNPIRECRFCGQLFNSHGKRGLYCKKHRGYMKEKDRLEQKATANL